MTTISSLSTSVDAFNALQVGEHRSQKQGQAPSAKPETAVVISIGGGVGASQSPQLVTTPSNVSEVLGWISSTNTAAAIVRSLESGDAENVGATKAAQDEKQWMTAIQLGAASLVRTAAQLGIDVNVSSTGTNSSVGIAVPSILTVGAFSFSSGGSTFEVKPDENGNLIGTKDGQAWNTWQLNNFTAGQPVGTSEADIALQALSSFTSSGGVSNNKTLTAVPLASPTSVNVAV